MANAGYPIEDIPDFWRRMGMEHPDSIASKWASTHPGTAERYLALDKTKNEIKAKLAAGTDLRPDPK